MKLKTSDQLFPDPIGEIESYSVKLLSAVMLMLNFDKEGSRPVAWNWPDCKAMREARQRKVRKRLNSNTRRKKKDLIEK